MKTPIRAWVLLFLDGLVYALGGVYWLLRGHVFDRALYEAIVPSWSVIVALAPAAEDLISALVRFAGALAIACGVLVMGMAASSFRRGERWSWYAAWVLPLQAGFDAAVLLGYGAVRPFALTFDLVVITLSLAALVGSVATMFKPGEALEEQPA